MSLKVHEIKVTGYERVLMAGDAASGYRGIIAIHNSNLGPALGGTRLWSYENDDAALTDVLRLARGMTYKNAMAGVPFGGGKSVIISHGGIDSREDLFRTHGKFIESLCGAYITGEDVGTGVSDMDFVHLETEHVAGLSNRSGDPSPNTARGVFRAIQASAKHHWGSVDLEGKSVALQGCGHVGYHLARELNQAGVRLFASDLSEERLTRVVNEFAAIPMAIDEVLKAEVDIVAPCGLGGVLNDETIPALKASVIAGAANNQLLKEEHGEILRTNGVLYAPDYIANAGGVISGCRELLGLNANEVAERVENIYSTLMSVYEMAEQAGISTNSAADLIAEKRLQKPTRTAAQ